METANILFIMMLSVQVPLLVAALVNYFKAISNGRMGERIHQLVNSSMGEQMKMTLMALERVYDLTNNPKDKDAVKKAKHVYDEHMRRQSNEEQA